MMQTMNNAVRAYEAASGRRNLRDQEADIFRQVTAALRGVRGAGRMPRLHAIADNQRLWSTVLDLLRDPENALPPDLKASIISVGLAVQRDMKSDEPNLEFLISINENIVAGLAGQP